MERPFSQSGEECAFTDAVCVEVCETGHGLSEDRMQFFIFYISSAQFRPFNNEL